MSQSTLASVPRDMNGEDARRSTRIERSIPLIIFGQNRMGEPFVERTVSTSLNLHGCRYPSRHDYGVGTWVTLQVVGLNVEPRPPSMRAKVKSVHVSHSARELQQVGVELETPGNVWGIAVPPQDWLSAGKMSATMPQFGTAVAPALMPSETAVSPDEPPARTEPRMADVATFPSPSPPASESPVAAETETAKPRRVVITPDGLVAALQGKLRQAAEEAAQAAVAKQVDEAVRQALCKIDDMRLSSIREIEELFPARIQSLKLPSKDDLAAEIASHWKEQMEMYRGQAEELAQRLEKQAADLRRELAKSQEFVDKMSREIEPQIHAKMSEAVTRAANEFEGATARAVERRYEQMLAGTHAVTQEALLKQRQSEMQVSMALAETRERAVATLSSLDAESRAACDARRQAIETDVARAAERSTDQFRKSMKAFLYSCLVAAVSAVDEHSKSTLDGLLKDNGKTLHEGNGETHSEDDTPIIPIIPDPDIDPLTH